MVGVGEVERTHQGVAFRGVLVGEGVVVGQPAVAVLDDGFDYRGELGVFVRFGKLLGVGAEHGREQTQLEPAHVEFGKVGILGIHGKASYVMAHVAETRQA